MKKLFTILFVGVVLLASFLRLHKVTSVPPSLNWDEVAMGYNAYSILHTGKDEYGKVFPLYFRSLDDYKRPVYVYAVVLSELVFGETDFAVRFPSALFGILSVVLIFLLTRELLHNKYIALLSAFCLAIVPWHVQFSRPAFEETIGLFFTACGILTFVWATRKSSWWLSVSAVSFTLSQYCYLSQRIVVPLLIVSLCVLYRSSLRSIWANGKKPILFSCIILSICFFSLIRDASLPEGSIRYKATNIFDNSQEYSHTLLEMQREGKLGINLIRRVFYDSTLLTSLGLVSRGYLTHFSPDFLFFDLGQYHHHAPSMGLLYVWMLPFLLIGIYLLMNTKNGKTKGILLIWLVSAPIPAAVTWQIPHALRVAEMIFPLQIIIAMGIYHSVLLIKRYKMIQYGGIGLLGIVILTSLIYYFHQYFIHLQYERSQEWVYGRKEMVSYILTHQKEYKKIILSTKLEWPYIYLLFYSHYDPATYLSQGGTRSGSWAEEGNRYDNYEFHRFDYLHDNKSANLLFVGKPEEFPSNVKPLKIIYFLNGNPAMYFVKSCTSTRSTTCYN